MPTTIVSKNAFGEVAQRRHEQGAIMLDISHQYANAAVCLYGGQVLSWQPKGQQEVFWLSKNAAYSSGNAIRGGIPICWPWFGANVDQHGVNGGNHGFARNHPWTLIDCDITENDVELIIELAGENLHRLWPQAFKLRQTLYFGQTFSQTLSMENLAEHQVNYSLALHSYFSVSTPLQSQVPLLDKVLFDDKITGLSDQQGQLDNCVGPIDRIFHHHGKQVIIDQQWQRKIVVEADNCQQWVLWNPGKVIAQGMPDIHACGENEFVCLEAANTQWQTIESGASVSVTQTISVEDI